MASTNQINKPSSNRNKNQTHTKTVPPTNPTSGVPFGYLPAYLPGSSSLVEQLDRRILIVLRDGRHLIGVLRSFDQFSNCVLEDTRERKILQTKKKGVVYMDIQLGLFLVRGDSMVLLGEVEEDEEADNAKMDKGALPMNTNAFLAHEGIKQPSMRKVSVDEFERLLKEEDTEEYKKSLLKWDFDTDLVV